MTLDPRNVGVGMSIELMPVALGYSFCKVRAVHAD